MKTLQLNNQMLFMLSFLVAACVADNNEPIPSSLFYLAENGVTCKCESANPGDKGFINGVEFDWI